MEQLSKKSNKRTDVQYEPHETPSPPIVIGLGFQLVVLTISGVILTPVIVIKAAGIEGSYILWAVFAALIISGLTTILQAVRIGQFGSGHVLLMGTSGAFIAVCVAALTQGGPAMLATLVVVSSFAQFFVAYRLSWLRNIFTPTVGGIVIMLIPVTVMPIVFSLLTDVAPEHQSVAAPMSAFVTILIAAGLAMKATGIWRLWLPLIGLFVGTVVSSFWGLYDFAAVAAADWVGLPAFAWPGLNFEFNVTFWALLPAFIFVTMVGLLETVGDSVGIQRMSWRESKAPDYRVVQGAVGADGVGNLLSGLMGTVPNTTYSTSLAVTELTGVASRAVGVCVGVIFLLFAFIPKLQSIIVAIPSPVVAAYVTVLLSMLFVTGMRLVISDQIDFRKGIIVGVSFWIGMGFQFKLIFPDFFDGAFGALLQNGMTAGGITALVLTMLWRVSLQRKAKFSSTLELSKLPIVENFVRATSATWDISDAVLQRLCLANEETILSLLGENEEETSGPVRTLLVTMVRRSGIAEIEYIAVVGEENIQDRVALLSESASEIESGSLSLLVLHHLATSVKHQKYFDTDIVTIQVSLK